MFGRNRNRKHDRTHARDARRRTSTAGVVIEQVEARTLMSSSVSTTMSPDVVYLRPSTTSTAADTLTSSPDDIDGMTPAEIETAYGFSGVTFSGGTIAADGAGQTIAIVDAYNDPNIEADLKTFDAAFDIAAPSSFKVVNQTGGSSLPTTDADWAGETSLDVEWAHAIAPGANILLVETDSDDTDDLMAGVNYARAASGVSVVSLSWGGSEYEDWGGGGETESQTALDADFTTPSGHQGVTFVAAAGDSGQQDGVQWPASSPNVISVGGTSLTLNDDNSIDTEVGWAGTSSGYSQVESEPTYQEDVQTTGFRSVADVSYDADPNTGFKVYDSLADDGYAGWQEVGGTSAGTPQWAALVAIADQGRVIAGTSTLNGVTQTLPDLYDLYSAYGSTDYSSYTSYFSDIVGGGTGQVQFHHGPGGMGQNTATYGYDLVTGLGTPKAASLIADLATSAADTGAGSGSTTTGGSGSTGTGTGTTTPAEALSPVAVTVLSTPPSAVIGGVDGSIKLKLTNTDDLTFDGPITLTIYASTTTAASTSDTVVKTVTLSVVHLGAGASKGETIKFDYPTTLATGSYYLVASADATATDTTPTTAATDRAITITAPTVDVSVAFASTAAVTVVPGKNGKVTLRLTNLGNVAAVGSVLVELYASANGTVASGVPLASVTKKKWKLGAGKSTTIGVSFAFPADLVAGDVSLVAAISPTTTPTDDNAANDVATAATQA
jgi:subtilase family serine protease